MLTTWVLPMLTTWGHSMLSPKGYCNVWVGYIIKASPFLFSHFM